MNDPAANAIPQAPADATQGSWVNRMPTAIRPYLQLSRFDRPAGFWLLGLPCLIGLALARIGTGFVAHDALLGVLFAIGAIAMRGAGCTYNDILDRRIDAQVARTALRPLPSGAVSLKQAWTWLLVQCFAGLVVLLCLPRLAQYVALGSIPLVALYPLMKRITWWPQIWLGLTFNWGSLVAASAVHGAFTEADIVLYAALIGVKSTARRFGAQVKPAIGVIYALCAALAAAAGWLAHGWIGAAVVLPFALHLAQQALRLAPDDGRLALSLFRANREAGLLLFAGWAFIAAFI